MTDYGTVQRSTMEGLAEQTRRLSGLTVTMTPKKAVAILEGLTIGTVDDEPATYMLVTPDGQEIPAVMVSDETVFTATENDIRQGLIAATAKGVTTGTKEIPPYYTAEGVVAIPNGKACMVKHHLYDYTKFQGIVCGFNTSLSNSVSAEAVAIENVVYPVLSTEVLAGVTKDHDNMSVALNINNTSGALCLVRYFMYKEEY